MPTTSVTINGRAYRLSCQSGEETRLQDLAETLNRRIDQLAMGGAHTNDERLLVMAALLATDEVLDLRARVAELEALLETDSPATERA